MGITDGVPHAQTGGRRPFRSDWCFLDVSINCELLWTVLYTS